MGAGATWWRRVAGLLATLALALAMFGPPAQAAPCADDFEVAAASAELPALPGVETPPDPDAEGCCPCVCCNTHGAGGFAPMESAALAAPSESAARHALASVPEPASKFPFGLKRPPRA